MRNTVDWLARVRSLASPWKGPRPALTVSGGPKLAPASAIGPLQRPRTARFMLTPLPPCSPDLLVLCMQRRANDNSSDEASQHLLSTMRRDGSMQSAYRLPYEPLHAPAAKVLSSDSSWNRPSCPLGKPCLHREKRKIAHRHTPFRTPEDSPQAPTPR